MGTGAALQPPQGPDPSRTLGRSQSSHLGETSPCAQPLPPTPGTAPQTPLCPRLLVPWPPHLASRNFLRRLGRSWLRRRRNQRSTWRPESPLCLDSSSTSACVQRRGPSRLAQNGQRPPALPGDGPHQHHCLPSRPPESRPRPPLPHPPRPSSSRAGLQGYLFGMLAVGQVEMLQGGVGGCPQSSFLLHVQEGSQWCGHITGEGT